MNNLYLCPDCKNIVTGTKRVRPKKQIVVTSKHKCSGSKKPVVKINMSSLKEDIEKIFSDVFGYGGKITFSMYGTSGKEELHIESEFVSESNMKITYNHLSELSKRFKTKKIDVNGFSQLEGCPTCNYGDNINYTISIINPKLSYNKYID